jgi:transcriptional regulator with AAA-type ATPase domain
MSDPGTLIVERSGEPILEVRLERGRTVLGSHPTSDVVLPDQRLPDAALVVLDTGERFRVRRLDPTIALPGCEDGEIDVEPGTTIPLGPHVIRLERRRTRARRADRTHRLETTASTAPLCATPGLALSTAARTIRVEPSGAFTIGSDPANDLVLDDPFVSAFHCRLAPTVRGWTLVDLDSTNGTQLGGLRVREVDLPPAGSLTVGNAELGFELVSPDTPGEGAPPPERFGLLGESSAVLDLLERLPRLASSAEPVLVTGESGTGKELVARALHEASGRKGPFLALNCGALSAALVESELFGHAKGAFTGAVSDRKGAFEATRGGTLFLDEVGELPKSLQPKLLRALETSSVRPVGATREIPVDVRIVAATHRDLEDLVARDDFREDLFHRLFVLGVRIPPLRERPEDIVPLARHFLARQPGARALSPAAELRLRQYSWPGNVRELRNVIIRAIYDCQSGPIDAAHLRFTRPGRSSGGSHDARRRANLDEKRLREHMLEALEESGGNRSEAARIMGVSKSTFFDRLKRFGIE